MIVSRAGGGVLAFLLMGSLFSLRAEEELEFRPLFNGKDLDGWVVVNTAPSTWHFEEGMLICSGKPIGEIRTERMFQNFVMELEWRHMVPKGNAGVFVWADDITARGQPFHRGIEVQVLENGYGDTESHTTHGDIFPIHGATMTPLTGHRRGSRAFPTECRSNPSPEWNHYRITCVDGMISLAVNGKELTRGADCQPRKGYVCLESEGGVVHYRNVRIAELPGGPLDEDDVAIGYRGYRCLYSGVDLAGWTVEGEGWDSRDWVLGYSGEAGGRLVSEEVFAGDFGFVVDVALDAKKEGAARFYPRGDNGVVIDLKEERLAPHLEKPGQWNRFEGKLSSGVLSLSVNGVEVDIPGRCPESGPMVLEAAGSIKWANIYVRGL